jgi:hypothetical protein
LTGASVVEIVRELVAPVPPDALFRHVGDLAAYPAWMPLIHDVERLADDPDGSPAWSVELRATVGPFARSKRLRMRRTRHEIDRYVVFERSEDDARHHSPWILRAELASAGNAPAETTLTMTMIYGGSLWTGPVLERVLEDQVRRGSESLLSLVS